MVSHLSSSELPRRYSRYSEVPRRLLKLAVAAEKEHLVVGRPNALYSLVCNNDIGLLWQLKNCGATDMLHAPD